MTQSDARKTRSWSQPFAAYRNGLAALTLTSVVTLVSFAAFGNGRTVPNITHESTQVAAIAVVERAAAVKAARHRNGRFDPAEVATGAVSAAASAAGHPHAPHIDSIGRQAMAAIVQPQKLLLLSLLASGPSAAAPFHLLAAGP